MKAFVFKFVEDLTDSWHSGGGLVVVAADRDAARAAIAGGGHCNQPRDAEWEAAMVYELAGAVDAAVFVFPNAGCC